MIYLDRNYGLGGQVEVRRPGLALVLREIKRRSFMRSKETKAAGKRLRPKCLCVFTASCHSDGLYRDVYAPNASLVFK